MSEISEFIKSKLGRCSARLSRSFQDYLDKDSSWSQYRTTKEFWESNYPDWIKTVRFRPSSGATMAPVESVDIQRLYKTIDKMAAEIKSLKTELTACKKNLRFQSPPAHVLKAMAEYGD
jgi:hypothetical protein